MRAIAALFCEIMEKYGRFSLGPERFELTSFVIISMKDNGHRSHEISHLENETGFLIDFYR